MCPSTAILGCGESNGMRGKELTVQWPLTRMTSKQSVYLGQGLGFQKQDVFELIFMLVFMTIKS